VVRLDKFLVEFFGPCVCRWAGGMRGAVSVALVYAYYDPNGTTTDRPRSTLISMTLTVVLISTLAFGAVTKPLLDILLGSKGRQGPKM
jgi:sodium/hydrogen exchanger 8